MRLLRRLPELNVSLIDTEAYGPYVGEELIAEALAPYSRGTVVGQKAALHGQGQMK